MGAPILVLGSINRDQTTYVRTLPAPGETVLSTDFRTALGGKGANQAIAAARLGGTVRFIGAVGDDSVGINVLRELRDNDVDTAAVATSSTAPTGRAFVAVEASGENAIVVIPGSNASITAAAVDAGVSTTLGTGSDRATLGLTQGEVPAAAIDRFAERCAVEGLRFVLNLAPVLQVAERTLRAANPLVLNRGEAAELANRTGLNSDLDLESVHGAGLLAGQLAHHVATSVVVTLGSMGAVFADATGTWYQESPRVDDVLDTTGAGDAFVGVLSAELALGAGLTEAVRQGVAAGSFAVSGRGTTEAYPTRIDLMPLRTRLADRRPLHPLNSTI